MVAVFSLDDGGIMDVHLIAVGIFANTMIISLHKVGHPIQMSGTYHGHLVDVHQVSMNCAWTPSKCHGHVVEP